jgi:hypothetical protein
MATMTTKKSLIAARLCPAKNDVILTLGQDPGFDFTRQGCFIPLKNAKLNLCNPVEEV